jgi:hypothetical protein
MSEENNVPERIYLCPSDPVAINHKGDRVGTWCSGLDDLVKNIEYIPKDIADKEREQLTKKIERLTRELDSCNSAWENR